ncbi:MAG: thioredoxin [Halobacteriales archaeon]
MADNDTPVHVNGAREFQSLVQNEDTVLVDFYADWCGPCKMMEPAVEQVAASVDATVAKVDIDANPRVAAAYGVQSVPTLLVFAGGEAVDRAVGAMDANQLRGFVERNQTPRA